MSLLDLDDDTFTTDDIIMKWSEERQSLNVLPDVNMPDFELINYTTHDCTAKYATGEFPCLYAKLTLKRQIGYYLTQTYIPSILIVTLSWISFWIDLQAIPARISVGLLTVLTITTQSTGAIAQLPRVPYIKSIDVWLSSCLVFVFAAYMEYAVVIVMARRHRKGTLSEQKQSPVSDAISDGVDNTGFDADGSYIGDCQPPTLKKKLSVQLKIGDRDLGVAIDKFSRQAFPAAFVLFNAVYWTYYKVLT